MPSQVSNICETLSRVRRCPGCGGNISGACCVFCGREITGSQELIQQLSTALSGEVAIEDFPSLVNIKDLDIPGVSEYIAASTENFRQHMVAGISSEDYGDLIRFLGAENHREVIPNADSMFPYIAKDYFDGKLADMDNDTYLQFIKAYADRIIQNSDMLNVAGQYPRVRFVPASEMPEGSTHGLCQLANDGSAILFNQDSFIQYKEENPRFNLIALYHEMQHAIRNNSVDNPERYDLTGFLIAQDSAIRSNNDAYYDENYEVLPAEADANFAAYQALNRDLMCCGKELSDIDEHLRHYGELSVNPYRKYNGVSTSTDELFEQLEINPGFLRRYPILGLVYECVDGKVVKKDNERLMEALQSEKNPNIAAIYRHALGMENVKDETQSYQQPEVQEQKQDVSGYIQEQVPNVQQPVLNANPYPQQQLPNINAFAQQAAMNANAFVGQAAMNINPTMLNSPMAKMQFNGEAQGKTR